MKEKKLLLRHQEKELFQVLFEDTEPIEWNGELDMELFYLDKEGKSIYLFNNNDMNDRFRISYRTSGKSLFPTHEGEGQLYTNIYPGRFGNNSININNVKLKLIGFRKKLFFLIL